MLLLILKKTMFLKCISCNIKEKGFPSLLRNMLLQTPQSLQINKEYNNFHKYE